jgi:monofunctional biosynthetic peptidoglycan transglycosylase
MSEFRGPISGPGEQPPDDVPRTGPPTVPVTVPVVEPAVETEVAPIEAESTDEAVTEVADTSDPEISVTPEEPTDALAAELPIEPQPDESAALSEPQPVLVEDPVPQVEDHAGAETADVSETPPEPQYAETIERPPAPDRDVLLIDPSATVPEPMPPPIPEAATVDEMLGESAPEPAEASPTLSHDDQELSEAPADAPPRETFQPAEPGLPAEPASVAESKIEASEPPPLPVTLPPVVDELPEAPPEPEPVAEAPLPVPPSLPPIPQSALTPAAHVSTLGAPEIVAAAIASAPEILAPPPPRSPATPASPSVWPRRFRRAAQILVSLAVGYAVLVLALIVAYRWIDPPRSALMIATRLSGQNVLYAPVPITSISSYLQRAVVTSEDTRFCQHRGVDWGALYEAMEESRGGSTITMQTAKNLFLWNSRSYIRKAIEIPVALTIDALWPKRRILEVYLNIAEWGPGIFGAEAASYYHFDKPAARLTAQEATLLAASLPNPIARDAGEPGRITSVLASRLRARMANSDYFVSCLGLRSMPRAEPQTPARPAVKPAARPAPEQRPAARVEPQLKPWQTTTEPAFNPWQN